MQINDFNLLTLFVHHLNLSSNHKYNTAGLDVNYCFEEKQNILYIHFEGSSSVTDWLRNFLFAKEPYRDMTFSFKVHRGFLSAWNEVKDIIYDKIMKSAKNERFKYHKICIVGYSHGGGLATLCHEFIQFYRPDLKDDLITFAFEAPRVIAKLSDDVCDRWSNYYIIKNANDIVTRVPPKLFGYTHVGYILQIGDTKKIERYKLWPKCVLAHTPDELIRSLQFYERERRFHNQ